MLLLYTYQMIFSVTQQVTCSQKCDLLGHIFASEAISARGEKKNSDFYADRSFGFS